MTRSDRSWRQPVIAISLAAGTLLVGYADLWNGGATMSALLLTVGYVILVPMAIVAVPRRSSTTPETRHEH